VIALLFLLAEVCSGTLVLLPSGWHVERIIAQK
jgi:hypothetical protein